MRHTPARGALPASGGAGKDGGDMKKESFYRLATMAAMFEDIGNTDKPVRNTECPSTRVRTETCPNCGKEHKSNKSLYCSKECNPHV